MDAASEDASIDHLKLKIIDGSSFNIIPFVNGSIKFIEENLAKTNVYVHCAAGVSRSPTIVIAFLMKKYN